MSALVLLVLAQFPTDVFERTDAFEQLEVRDGVTMFRRAVKGSPYFEYRARTETTYSVQQLCDAVFEWGSHEGDGPAITASKVLTDGPSVRVIYQQISKPIVARRDYAMTIAQDRPTETTCRIRFRTTNEHAPARPDGFVRIEKMWGEWLFEPGEKKGRVTYTLFSDPAGSVPTFLVHGGQRDATRESLLTGVAKTKKRVEGAK